MRYTILTILAGFQARKTLQEKSRFMDLRKFFGSSTAKSSEEPKLRKGPPKSALSEIKDKISAPASKNKEPDHKESPLKRRTSKNVIPPTVDIADEDSDESPLPSSVLNMNKGKKKRSRVILSSDSEDEIPLNKTKDRRERNKSPEAPLSPVKKRGRVARTLSTSPETTPAKKTPIKKLPKSPSPKKNAGKGRKEEDDEDEEVVISDSEDEFTEKVVKKKGLLKGQKTLTYKPSDIAEASKAAPPVRKGTAMDPMTFFGGAKSVATKVDTKKVTKEQAKEQMILADRSNDVSKKTPVKETKTHDVDEDDEFLEKDEEPVPVRSTSQKARQEEKPKKRDRTISPEKAKKMKNEVKKAEKEAAPPSKKARLDPAPAEKCKGVKAASQSPRKKVDKENAMKALQNPKTSSSQHLTAAPARPPPSLPWVDKYKPKSFQQLVGQHGDKSPMNKLLAWLKGWKTWHLGEGAKIKRPKPPPFVETDGSPFKAVLLSGAPGIGKTTCAHMACEQLGFKVVEMNASDVRNKKHLEAQVAQLTGCHQVEEYFGRTATGKHDDTEVHHVLIMDEVDGMSGNEDRAGLAELISIIKDTKIPIICICNDRGHAKMRTLVNYAHDVKFSRPRAEQMLSRIMSIAAQEKLKLSKDEAMELIELSGHDVRQCIYNLQMKAAGRVAGKDGAMQQKDFAVNSFEAARKLLNQESSLMDRQQMFFVDYGIMPLFVQENYPKMVGNERSRFKGKDRNDLANLRKAADLLAHGDTIERAIRSGGAWKLLNEQSMLGAALPAIAMDGNMKSMILFPSWLGRNSTAGKRMRMMRQLEHHAHLKVSASPSSLVMDYVPLLRDRLTRPLVDKEAEGVPDVVATMVEYDLLREDADAIAELAVWPGAKDPADKILPKVKAALTRTLNKTARKLPYVVEDVSKGRKKAAGADMDNAEVDEFGQIIERTNEDDASLEDEEEEEEVKPKAAAKGGRVGGSSGRGGRGGRGRGRGK